MDGMYGLEMLGLAVRERRREAEARATQDRLVRVIRRQVANTFRSARSPQQAPAQLCCC